ncbi:Sulfite oxidase [Labilithrix luteola]|uniref:Sulfite oxidase n=1 Tax=Labilithrix luteola TaxID=1391654 RepID=A0A0K1PQL8_9BACT|nr:molybdopterin-dependent oxidoreductase [Labilithrix luteola]AKU95835.1 Sulfite oxidase [Labilithrix luteola]
MGRRRFLRGALAAGTAVVALGGATYVLASEEDEKRARATLRPDGRPRLPPNQYLLKRIRPMGGSEGDPSPGAWRLKVYGEVEAPFTIDFKELLAMTQVEQICDVHCVTKWTCLDSKWTGVKLAELAARAKPKPSARHVIFEAAEGYTSNVPIREALAPNVLIAHKYEGQPLARAHGAPVRAVVPDLYFWKSAKWLTGIRFVTADKPGYWETRGYHNHADPWKEERYG